MKYIDAELLMTFLQKKLESYKSKIVDPSKYPIDHIDLMALLASEYQALIFQINSLQQEQPEINLEEAFDEYIEHKKAYIKDDGVIKYYNGDSFNHIYDIYPIARHFYELGKNSK